MNSFENHICPYAIPAACNRFTDTKIYKSEKNVSDKMHCLHKASYLKYGAMLFTRSLVSLNRSDLINVRHSISAYISK